MTESSSQLIAVASISLCDNKRRGVGEIGPVGRNTGRAADSNSRAVGALRGSVGLMLQPLFLSRFQGVSLMAFLLNLFSQFGLHVGSLWAPFGTDVLDLL